MNRGLKYKKKGDRWIPIDRPCLAEQRSGLLDHGGRSVAAGAAGRDRELAVEVAGELGAAPDAAGNGTVGPDRRLAEHDIASTCHGQIATPALDGQIDRPLPGAGSVRAVDVCRRAGLALRVGRARHSHGDQESRQELFIHRTPPFPGHHAH